MHSSTHSVVAGLLCPDCEMVPVPVSLLPSEVWARVPCPLSSVVTAGPQPPPAHRLRGGSFEHGPIISRVLSNNIKRHILTSLENINYLRCETRGTPIVLHAVVNILFIFASKLACQETESIYLDLICFVLRKEFEN